MKHVGFAALSLALWPFALRGAVAAQCQAEQVTSTGADPTDRFGWSADVSSDTLVVGAYQDEGPIGEVNQGAAYVFVRHGNEWCFQQKLQAPDGGPGDDFFGIRVAIDGDTIVVGAMAFDNPGSGNGGAAYVFERTGTTWGLASGGILVPGDLANGDEFGRGVDISGNTVAVSAWLDDVGSNQDQGSVYVFVNDSPAGWSQQAKLTSADGGSFDDLGRRIALSGDTLIAGAPLHGGADAGAAYVFTRSGGTWTQQAKLESQDAAGNDQFGFAVDVYGDRAVVGAYGDDSVRGSTYVFERTGSTWSETAKLVAPGGAPFDSFGYAVALEGDRIAAGAYLDDHPGGVNQGSVYLYELSVAGWSEGRRYQAPDAAQDDWYGYSVELDSGTIVVGAPLNDHTSFSDAGSVYVLDLGRWGDVFSAQKISAIEGGAGGGGFGGTLAASDGFGSALTLLGDLDGDGNREVAVGAPTANGAGDNRGAVWILSLRTDGKVVGLVELDDSDLPANELEDGDNLGAAVASLGDLDGDGVTDLAVGAPGDDSGGSGSGAVWILFLNADGTIKAQHRVAAGSGGLPAGALVAEDSFGIALANIGDVDGDGVTDLAAGAPGVDDGGPGFGSAWILFLNTNGTLDTYLRISDDEGGFPPGAFAQDDGFGSAVADLGDLDGSDPSSMRAIAVGERGDNDAGVDTGKIWILFLASTGAVVSHRALVDEGFGFSLDLQPGDFLGQSLANVGDLGGPGVLELAAGIRDDEPAMDAGSLWLLSLDRDGSLAGRRKIPTPETIPDALGDRLGSSIASVGDLDGDGRIELGVGANRDDDGVFEAGACWILFANDGTFSFGAGTSNWTGAADSDWTDPLNWSNGTPDMNKTAIIPDAATTPNDPEITVGGQQCNTLWVQSAGTLDVSAGMDSLGVFGGATVSGPITGTGELVFEAEGTLAGAATIGLPDVRADADLSVQGGPLLLGGTLTGNQGVSVELGAKLEVQTDLLVLGDLLLDGALSVGDFLDVGGILTSTSSGNVGSLEVGEIGACGGGITVGQICFHGEVATSCPLNIENGSSSSSLVLDIAEGWPAGVSVDVLGGTITLESSDFSIGGDLVLESGTLAIGVSGTLDVAGASGIVIEAPGTLDIGPHQTLVPAPAPITVRGKLNVGPGGELQLESNALVVEAGGSLCLSGGASNLAGIVGANGGGYALSVLDGATIAAKNFVFTGMGPAGITIARDALIEAAPLDLRNGLFDLPSAGGRLLALERSAPTTLRYLAFENTNAAGTVNVHVPGTSALITLVNWSGAFSGPGFEDDPGMQLDWGPPELTEASLSARWKPDHVQVAWTTTSEIDAEAFLLRRSIEPAGPFQDMHETPSTGPGSYAYADWTVAPGTAYRYRLYERLTHGVLVQLDEALLPASELPVFLPNWGRPAPPPPPAPPAPLPLVIGSGGSYPDVPSAVAQLSRTHSGTHVSLELAPGRHAAFELHELPLDLQLAARAGAWIDASAGPVRITGLSASHSLELVGLTLDAERPERLALELEDCAGVVLLDALELQGSARLVSGRAVVLQGCTVSGGLLLERGSRAAASGTELGDVRVQPGSDWRERAQAPELVLRDGQVEITGSPGSSAWLFCARRLGWRAAGQVEGTWLLDALALESLGPRVLVDGRAAWSLPAGQPGSYAQALLREDGCWKLSTLRRRVPAR